MRAFVSNEIQSKVAGDLLEDSFGNVMDQEMATLKVTCKRRKGSELLPHTRRYKEDPDYSVKRIYRKFDTDTMSADGKSISSNVEAQIQPHKCDFPASYPMSWVNG